jgi:hypothetical protein
MVFNGPTKLIVLSSSTLDLQALWSAWKDWLLAGNAQYALAMNTVGGEPIDPSAGTMVPLYLFLLNGWKLRPMEADHTLNVSGGTLLVEGGGDPFVSTLGDFTVRIRYQQPVQAIGYSTSGSSGVTPSVSEIAEAVVAALSATAIPVNVKSIRGAPVVGSGTSADPWRPA